MNMELIGRTAPTGRLMRLGVWSEAVGITACTAWRWRRYGWLETVNVAGRVYVTAEAIEQFVARAQRGEFARAPRVPRRQGGASA